MDGKVTANKWFLPLVWASDIVSRALAEGNIRPQTVRALIAELCNIREKLTGIMNHDWVSVPLVYTQTVTLAVYPYFVAALIGGQWIYPESPEAHSSSAGSRCPVSLYHIIVKLREREGQRINLGRSLKGCL